MRTAILVVAALAACHPPSLKDRAIQLGAKVSSAGSKAVAIVQPHVTAFMQSPAGAMIEDQARARLGAAIEAQASARLGVDVTQPIAVHRTVVHDQSVAAAPAPTLEPAMTMTVTHVDAAQHTFFGLRNGRSCTRYESLDECNRACTALHASCSCLEDAPGC